VRALLLQARSVLLTDRSEAKLLTSMPHAARADALARLPAERAAGVLGAMDAAERNATVAALDAQSRAGALASMPPRRAAVTLAATPAEVRAAVLTAMTPHAAALALRLMPEEARMEASIRNSESLAFARRVRSHSSAALHALAAGTVQHRYLVEPLCDGKFVGNGGNGGIGLRRLSGAFAVGGTGCV
jgi:Mg/Co/Ni transporter MgtE